MAITRQDVLEYHRRGRPGKIEVRATKPLVTQQDLSLAYSPGVAEAVLEIDRDSMAGWELTARANLVAVITNGSAILGLGNLGPLPAKAVMEGKGVLFKRFADIDVFDIELDTDDPEEFIAICKALAPTFGGINLEDIKAPEAFEIETRLKAELDIPVFHDDQHGTAIIAGAALLNAAELVGKSLADMRVVISGAGASAIASGEFCVQLGVAREHVLMLDSRGVIYAGREEHLNEYKVRFANYTDARTLDDAIVGADVFLGLSAPGVLTADMVKKMARDPVILAMANPDPEIMPEDALAVRPDAIVGTGRSDYPNQVNNVLGFPFLFRGALDVYARSINEEMKLAAAHALAALAREDVPDSVLTAYGLSSLKFGRDYLIPKPLDPRVLLWVAPEVARAAMDSGAARRQIDLKEYRMEMLRRQGHGQTVRASIMNKARAGGAQTRVVYGEGEHPRIIRAAYQMREEGIGTPVLLGDRDAIEATIRDLGLDFAPRIVTPHQEQRADWAQALVNLRRRRGMTPVRAAALLQQNTHYGLMMVHMGAAEAFISGLTQEYPAIMRPSLQIFGTAPGARVASGLYLMIVEDRSYFFTDTTVNIDPDAETLADIAMLGADFAKTLDIEPRVAMLSFSNFGSTPHPFSRKVRDAVALVSALRPDLMIDGEMQADTAVVDAIVNERYPFSEVRDANVLVFPDLGSANIAYKLLNRLAGVEAIGPILLGMGEPVHVLQAGDDVDDIVAMTAVAVMDAQARQAARN